MPIAATMLSAVTSILAQRGALDWDFQVSPVDAGEDAPMLQTTFVVYCKLVYLGVITVTYHEDNTVKEVHYR